MRTLPALVLASVFLLLASCDTLKTAEPQKPFDFPDTTVAAEKVQTFAGVAKRGSGETGILEVKGSSPIVTSPDWPDELIGKDVKVSGVWSQDLPESKSKPQTLHLTRVESGGVWKPKARP